MAVSSFFRGQALVAAGVILAMAGVAAAMVGFGTVRAYTPMEETFCGRAFQEWRNLFDEVAGRCHLARQDRLWLAIRVGSATVATGAALFGVVWLLRRRTRPVD